MRTLIAIVVLGFTAAHADPPRAGGAVAARATDLAGQIESDRELSLAFAGIVEVQVAPSWSLAAEPGIGGAGSSKYDLLYAALPIVGRFRYPLAPAWRLRATGGVAANVLLKADVLVPDDDGDVREGIRDHLRWWDATVVLGVGVERGKWFGELRYKRGLATIHGEMGGLHVVTEELGLWIGAMR